MKNHARYIESEIPYHVISKTIQGLFLLVPKKKVTNILAGVVGRAQRNWPDIKLYGYAFLSNHFHLIAQGKPNELIAFVGFIKRESSRRIGVLIDIPGPFWTARFKATALPTEKSQEKGLEYVLAQSVKEDLVEKPQQWPGLHCAKPLLSGHPQSGNWFDGTSYGRLLDRAKRTLKPSKINRSKYFRTYPIQLSCLPGWESLSVIQWKQRIKELVDKVIDTERQRRLKQKKRVVGRKQILKFNHTMRSVPPAPPWFETRKRQITAWAKRSDPITRAFVNRYWAFQNAFRKAADAARDAVGQNKGDWKKFPTGGWSPPLFLVPT